MIMFKNMKKAFSAQTESSFTLPTSAIIDRGNHGGNDSYENYEDHVSQSDLDQHSPNMTANGEAGKTIMETLILLMVITTKEDYFKHRLLLNLDCFSRLLTQLLLP